MQTCFDVVYTRVWATGLLHVFRPGNCTVATSRVRGARATQLCDVRHLKMRLGHAVGPAYLCYVTIKPLWLVDMLFTGGISVSDAVCDAARCDVEATVYQTVICRHVSTSIIV